MGVASSPSCGVTTTSSGYKDWRWWAKPQHARVAGWGVFMEVLLAELERRRVAVRAAEMGGSTGGEGMGSDDPGAAHRC